MVSLVLVLRVQALALTTLTCLSIMVIIYKEVL